MDPGTYRARLAEEPMRIVFEEVVPPVWQQGDIVIADDDSDQFPSLPNYAGFLPPFFERNGLRVFRRVKP